MTCRPSCIVALVVATAVCGGATPSNGQDTKRIRGPTCERLEPLDWLVAPPSNFRGEKISADLVLVVRSDVPRAVSLLERSGAVRINDEDIMSFTGAPPPRHPPGLQPYLVRAVDMGPSTALEVRSENGALSVFTFRLGCPHHLKTPIIVFLPAVPRLVFVQAGGAL